MHITNSNTNFKAKLPKLSKVNWRKDFSVEDKSKFNFVLDNFSVQHPTLGKLDTEVLMSGETFESGLYDMYLRNEKGELVGYECYVMDPETKDIYGMQIKTKFPFRKKYGIGELLRLSSLMEFLKNGGKSFDLLSVDDAIYFHSKYKFSPNFYTYMEVNDVLDTISKEKSINFIDLKEKSKKIQSEIKLSSYNIVPNDDLVPEAQDLTKEYILRAIEEKNPQQKHPFATGMNMRLDVKDIIDNKDFFNGLYEKHGIDFKI